MALLHVVLWLIHAVAGALASALVDVLTHVTTAIVALLGVVACAALVAGACSACGFTLFRRRRDRQN